jgi:hypothetical protein
MKTAQYYEQLTKNVGSNKPYQYKGLKCTPLCINMKHNETKHHATCPFYPGSFSERFTNMEKFVIEVLNNSDKS